MTRGAGRWIPAWGTECRDLHLLNSRTGLFMGGHSFVCVSPVDVELTYWRCTGCHGVVPRWALSEGYVLALLGERCPDALTAVCAATSEPHEAPAPEGRLF